MNSRPLVTIWSITLALLLPACSDAPSTSSFMSALTDPPEGFKQAHPGMQIRFPQDMGVHPEFRLEWWYLTANLESEGGEQFGVQWTLFRNGIKPGPYYSKEQGRMLDWQRNEVWFAHAAVSRPNQHWFADRAARGGSGQADVTVDPFTAWIDHWQLSSDEDGDWNLEVAEPKFQFRLRIQPRLPPIFHGEQGFSAKSAGGGGSMYFSYPDLAIEGEIAILDNGKTETFTVTGQGWFDREWSSQYLKEDQQGWDWMALHLDDGRHLMLFRVRGAEDFYSATLVAADGATMALNSDDFTLAATDYRKTRFGQVPVVWRVAVPTANLELDVHSWPGEYWNAGAMRYWEGPVTVKGSHSGAGYLEMTGYGD
ncbi:lipocalin-like domain-containing protein [Microbulbifer agarilyticus]|uniref:lipocalin-like domain-containing protein n=1 Tax=Microbulbifer agarilyticus TaxID=260552 RepID=UPI001CD19BB5|nr:lipocalin-like domain-containing protein [Microbulbifer agarilyticus]MCA0901498.1 carotenoid 1,2-hydratase [Microbulbifer agarilyticus]